MIRKPAHKRTLEDYIKEAQRLEGMDTENLLYPSKDTMPRKAPNSPVEPRSLVLQGGGSLEEWKRAVNGAFWDEHHRRLTELLEKIQEKSWQTVKNLSYY